jgi:hypothetical protein
MSVFADAIEFWKLYYRQHPITLIMMSFILVVSVAGVLTFNYTVYEKAKKNEKERAENLSYNKQLDALNAVQASLNNLMQFVDLEKAKLKESEDLINSLKSEQEKLRPVVEANRQTVDAILEVQSQRQKQGIWWERAFGFLLGVISSIVASAVVAVVRYIIRRRQAPPATA